MNGLDITFMILGLLFVIAIIGFILLVKAGLGGISITNKKTGKVHTFGNMED